LSSVIACVDTVEVHSTLAVFHHVYEWSGIKTAKTVIINTYLLYSLDIFSS